MSVANQGSSHDSMAFSGGNLTAALERFATIGDGMYLVGDAAYKGIPGIITPFDGNNLPVYEDSYNHHQSQIRINIECAFGMLVNRWGIFWRGLRTDSFEIATAVVQVCFRLHNFIIDMDAEFAEPMREMGLEQELRTDIQVDDRLTENHRPKATEHGPPIDSLWFQAEENANDLPTSALMRRALVQRLERLQIRRPHRRTASE